MSAPLESYINPITFKHFPVPGKPTKVEFHVTVMSLDSINEGSMVNISRSPIQPIKYPNFEPISELKVVVF